MDNNQESYATVKNLTETIFPPNEDNNGSGVIIYGWAPLGTAEDSPKWKIRKKTISGTITTWTCPDGQDTYSFKWSDRGSLTYTR